MKKALMYGAGNIGRGFIGQLFSNSGYEVIFLDINSQIIDTLNREKQYPVVIVSQDGEREEFVKNVRGVLAGSSAAVATEMKNCDIMAISLGVNVLPYIAEKLALGISKRIDTKQKLDILICENLKDADVFLKNLIFKYLSDDQKLHFDTYIGLVETSIGRMVPVPNENAKKDNPLTVFAEEYSFLPVDKEAFKGSIPDIKGLYPYSPFMLFIERKLYMHNMAHAITAYLGYLCKCTYIYEACAIAEIRYIVYRALIASAEALSKKYSYPLEALLSHASNLMFRFSNVKLKDTIERVGKDTKRKLSQGDRLEGTLKLLQEQSIDESYLHIGIAAALLFGSKDNNCIEASNYLKTNSVEKLLQEYCGINDSKTIQHIEKTYDKLKNNATPLIEIITQIEAKQNAQSIL